MADGVVGAPKSQAAALLADWLELMMLVEAIDEIARLEIMKRLATEPLDDLGQESEDAGTERLAKYQARVDRLLVEVARRAETAPSVYPFRVADGVVTRETTAGGDSYLFMLWLAFHDAPFRVEERIGDSEELWDKLAQAALEVLVGPTGDSRLFAQRYATDPETAYRRPKSFPDAIEWLRGHLRLGPGINAPKSSEASDVASSSSSAKSSEPAPIPGVAEAVQDEPDDDDDDDDDDRDLPLRTYSDGGVDVVAWQHFRDGRRGFPVLLAQCTVQEKWRPKTRDVSVTLWRSWIDFATRPQKLLAIPFAVPDKTWWTDRNRLAGMILDRMRVAELLEECGAEWLSELSKARGRWLAVETGLFNKAVIAPTTDSKSEKPAARGVARDGEATT